MSEQGEEFNTYAKWHARCVALGLPAMPDEFEPAFFTHERAERIVASYDAPRQYGWISASFIRAAVGRAGNNGSAG